jgi:hypothetical protein
MHQKEQYNTLEEFRVLPALLRGAVIVAEDVPLREVVPYHRYAISSNQTISIYSRLFTLLDFSIIFNGISQTPSLTWIPEVSVQMVFGLACTLIMISSAEDDNSLTNG